MTPLAALFALLIGVSLGMLGAGGSAITVPVFVYIVGLPPKEAIASSLPVVGTVALIGAFRHARCGNLSLRIALIMAPTAMAGAFAGAKLAALVSGTTQMLMFAAVMMTAAILMFRDTQPGDDKSKPSITQVRVDPLLPGLVGAVVGIMTGLVGVGGGFLIVPALVLFQRIPMRLAVGTSLAVIAFNSAAGFAGYVGHTVVQWNLIAGFAVFAAAGIFTGAALVKHVSQPALRRSFAIFLAVISGVILTERLSANARSESGETAKIVGAHGGKYDR